jgi:hypothetical protein
MTALDTVIYALDERGCRPRGSDERGYTALCPAHDDRSPSLAVRERGGRVLVHCFTGCTAEAILDALALEWTDLFDDDGVTYARGRGSL